MAVLAEETARDTPGPVIAAIAAGVAPMPFLTVYAVIFIGHGVFYPVQPPDITTTRGGEAVAGLVTVGALLVLIVATWWFLSGRRRWLFLAGQSAVLAGSLYAVTDSTTGPSGVPAAAGGHLGARAGPVPDSAGRRVCRRSGAGGSGVASPRSGCRARESARHTATTRAVHTESTDFSQL